MIEKKPDIVFSERLNESFFRNREGGFFVECGAADGIDHSICWWFEEHLGWHGINIEPNPYAFEQLQRNRPKTVNENLALSDSEGLQTLYIPTGGPRELEPLQASLERSRKEFWAGKTPERYKGALRGSAVKEMSVKTDTYSNVISRNSVNRVDLFILDVEGHEVKALAGMINSDVLPTVISVENNKANMLEVRRLLEPLGFRDSGGWGANSFFTRGPE